MHSRLRSTLSGATVLALFAAGAAQAADKVVDLGKAFPFLANFLKIAPAERNRFTVSYVFRRDGQPLTAPLWIIKGAQRTSFPLKPNGETERLPTTDQLEHAKLQIGVPPETKLSLSFNIRPTMTPDVQMDARELATSISQAAAAVHKAAGVFALAAPKLQKVVFLGVSAGQAELQDGRRVGLPLEAGHPVFNPSSLANVRLLRFSAPPSAMTID